MNVKTVLNELNKMELPSEIKTWVETELDHLSDFEENSPIVTIHLSRPDAEQVHDFISDRLQVIDDPLDPTGAVENVMCWIELELED